MFHEDMITKKDVQHIAKLARLGISKTEEAKFAKELSLILSYVEKLKEVDISKIEPTSHPRLIENVMREDKIKNQKSKIKNQKLMDLAPERKKGYIKVKAVF